MRQTAYMLLIFYGSISAHPFQEKILEASHRFNPLFKEHLMLYLKKVAPTISSHGREVLIELLFSPELERKVAETLVAILGDETTYLAQFLEHPIVRDHFYENYKKKLEECKRGADPLFNPYELLSFVDKARLMPLVLRCAFSTGTSQCSRIMGKINTEIPAIIKRYLEEHQDRFSQEDRELLGSLKKNDVVLQYFVPGAWVPFAPW